MTLEFGGHEYRGFVGDWMVCECGAMVMAPPGAMAQLRRPGCDCMVCRPCPISRPKKVSDVKGDPE